MKTTKQQTENLIPLADFIFLNRRGFPCSDSWKYRLIKEGKFPHKTVVKSDGVYVVTD